jgi:DNA-binding transcriptional LysR family regulator
MQRKSMKDVDLNLLPPLNALLELRNVSRAAARVHVSQPAMSASLARLRKHFNDELLVRQGREYQLTPFAEQLAPRVELAFGEVEQAMQLRNQFAPETSDRSFTIAASDYATSLLIRSLRGTIAAEAPGVSVHIVPTATITAGSGPEVFSQVDVVVGPMGFDFKGQSRQLFRDEFVAIVSADNPLLNREHITVQDLAEQPHAVGDFGADVVTLPMQMFRDSRIDPVVAARMSGFQSLPSVVHGTDLVAMVPLMLAARSAQEFDIRIVRLADELESPLVEALYWHTTQTNDPANTWLREVIKQAAAGLSPELHEAHPIVVEP